MKTPKFFSALPSLEHDDVSQVIPEVAVNWYQCSIKYLLEWML